MKIIVYSIRYNTLTKTKINSYYDAAIKRSNEILNFSFIENKLSFKATNNDNISVHLKDIKKIIKVYELSNNTFFFVYEN